MRANIAIYSNSELCYFFAVLHVLSILNSRDISGLQAHLHITVAFSRVHTSANAADPTEFLLLNKCRIKHMVRWAK